MRDTQERDSEGVLSGTTPVSYRMVLEFERPVIGRKKNPETGNNAVPRVELFCSDENLLYWLVSFFSRAGHPMTRAEAVVLAGGSQVTWRDKNAGERE